MASMTPELQASFVKFGLSEELRKFFESNGVADMEDFALMAPKEDDIDLKIVQKIDKYLLRQTWLLLRQVQELYRWLWQGNLACGTSSPSSRRRPVENWTAAAMASEGA
jgi:hypothetical protein